jgi:ABC-2 type transport system permease protein
MNPVLVLKLLRDARTGLIAVCLLLGAFEFLWCKVTEQNILFFRDLQKRMSIPEFAETLFKQESGKIVQKLIGGEHITFGQGLDILTIGYVEPLALIILCVWAIGRAAGAVAGELDKGTMELLLAQPLPRWRVIGSHAVVELLTIPVVCLAMWAGTLLGAYTYDLVDLTTGVRGARPIDPWIFGQALPSVAALLFAVSGFTMLLSSMSRSRTRVLGAATMLTLIQFLINLIGQVWPLMDSLRPFTVFYYFQPQPILLEIPGAAMQMVGNVAMLGGIGLIGYAAATLIFCRRDLPAPL